MTLCPTGLIGGERKEEPVVMGPNGPAEELPGWKAGGVLFHRRHDLEIDLLGIGGGQDDSATGEAVQPAQDGDADHPFAFTSAIGGGNGDLDPIVERQTCRSRPGSWPASRRPGFPGRSQRR